MTFAVMLTRATQYNNILPFHEKNYLLFIFFRNREHSMFRVSIWKDLFSNNYGLYILTRYTYTVYFWNGFFRKQITNKSRNRFNDTLSFGGLKMILFFPNYILNYSGFRDTEIRTWPHWFFWPQCDCLVKTDHFLSLCQRLWRQW